MRKRRTKAKRAARRNEKMQKGREKAKTKAKAHMKNKEIGEVKVKKKETDTWSRKN